MNVFHQFGGVYWPDGDAKITPDDLKNSLSEIAKAYLAKM